VTADLVVRRARLDDLQAIVELRLALLREYHDHPLYELLRPDAPARAYDLFRSQLLSPAEAMFVAERNRTTIGVLRCVESGTSPLLLPDRYCYVSSVYVRPTERRQGVLRAMLAAAEAWCDERGLTEMRLHSSTSAPIAVDTWDALGFEIVEHVRRRALAPASQRIRPHAHAESR
jgi:ribosomal protein S18 acetylase RimI-like enzyme